MSKVKNITLDIKDFSKGLNLSDAENISDLSYNVSCYNFDFKSGALVEGVGFEGLTHPQSTSYGATECQFKQSIAADSDFVDMWVFRRYTTSTRSRQDTLMFRLADTQIFCADLVCRFCVPIPINDLKVTGDIYAKNIRMYDINTILMSSNKEGVYTYNGESKFVLRSSMPTIIDLCYHKDKVFIIEALKKQFVRYSTNTKIEEMTKTLTENEGIISFDDDMGEVEKLISQYGYLFLIREYGVTKVTTYENSKEFNISNIYASGTKVYCKTVCCCGDSIVMLTRNGLYEFNANKCEKINTKLNDFLSKITNDKAIACFRNGVYYISCRIDFNDGKKIGCENEDDYINNVFICYNVIDKTYSINRGIDVSQLLTVQSESFDKVVAMFGSRYKRILGQLSNSGSFFDETNERYWCSPLSDLGYSDKMKYVRYLSLLSSYDCSVTVFTEKTSKTFNVKGSKLLTKIPVNVKGKQIGIKITTNSKKAYISNLKLSIDLLDSLYQ